MSRSRSHLRLAVALLALALLIPTALASSGDRNPTFQHCLRGCMATSCEPSSPPVPIWLSAFGWDCEGNCKYECGHMFTDNIRPGGRWHQFYGKWPFYRLGPIQEPFSVLMSLGNLYVNLKGLGDVRRRVRSENRMRRWLEAIGWVGVNTWIWSTVFHFRDTPMTERLDYFSATLTISLNLLYALLRIPLLLTPVALHRLAVPVIASIGFLVLSHFTYLLSFPTGSFPYGYHTKFNVILGLAHFAMWITFSLAFYIRLPAYTLPGGRFTLAWPKAYPPRSNLDTPKPRDALTPLILVGGTAFAMSLELFDFHPILRLIDAHSLWHAATIPLTMAWWIFLCNDAIELEGGLLQQRGVSSVGVDAGEKMPLTGGAGGPGQQSGGVSEKAPQTPDFRTLATGAGFPPRQKSPGRKEGRVD